MTKEKKPNTDCRDTLLGQLFGYPRMYVGMLILIALVIAGQR
jgi:hypothetical protein